MSPFKDAFTEHQIKRWIRPDAYNFVRPDWRRFVQPGFERGHPFELYEHKYSPDQPRDWHGRWTDGPESNASPSSTDIAPTTENGRISNQIAAECDDLHRKDLFICRAVRLRACYEQAYLRLSNCQLGKPYPPLNF
jgi:hypothetical protein